MRGTLLRYVVRTYLQFFVGILGAVLAIFLVADFVDRGRNFTGEGWVAAAALLYANKALVAAHQLGPAAMLLAAGATVSSLRKRGEVTAIRALTFGPAALYLPIGLCALVLGLGLIAFDESVVVRAGRRIDEINTQRFNRWGDWRFYYTPKQWFRRGDRVFYLRGGDAQAGFEDATVLTLTSDFRLARRLDAQRMRPLAGTQWELTGVVERTFTPEGATHLRSAAHEVVDLGVAGGAFRIRPGRPEQMRVPQLRQQLDARKEVGLPTALFSLALHNRFAYGIAGLPAALLAVGLALRPGRRGHLTMAMVEGLVVVVVLWGMMVVGRTLATNQHLPPWLAAWAPTLVLAVASAVLWLRTEGIQRRAAR
ncbi:YjgP/YjgQ family permease [Aggregicoccus sp. 17bor-14]|uniref:LptF/LptG family permease n=1 Tax=Myxococcaceae TaxID=31 RepID=UPI00129C94F8|nr:MULTISPECIES: LptF/LptG family permease [Myxococcaceae]MBF5041295.1 LptF/LptG family permease [Simulacricoccus sp. 17bor-14]MRI87081.1 YjgP/YjgQ family permease [Aggregicoccus sp. 17bor-14]